MFYINVLMLMYDSKVNNFNKLYNKINAEIYR